MQYLVIAYDYNDVLEKRLEFREEHIQATKKLINEGKILSAAALIEDDEMVGSTLVLNFDNDDEINEWIDNEVYVKNGIWNMEEFQMVPIKVIPKD